MGDARAAAMTEMQLVSPEVLARVHSEQLRLMVLMGEIEREAGVHGNEPLAMRVATLAESLRMHMGLVDAILDALTPDAQRSAPRPRRRRRGSPSG
jgi:isochorismate synthase EntC